MTRGPAWSTRVGLLVCPLCRDALTVLSEEDQQGVLGHGSGQCTELYPVIDGIPRLLLGDARSVLMATHSEWFDNGDRRSRFERWTKPGTHEAETLRIVERFDREWQTFDRMDASERRRLFDAYFDLVPDRLIADALVLDAGCGSGRWSHELGRRRARVVAMDLGASIEVASRTDPGSADVTYVQADVVDAPFDGGVFDLVCSLGVLHHVVETDRALRNLVQTIRPGGQLLLYVYYGLDLRPSWYRALYALADVLRRLISALPHPGALLITTCIAALVYWPLSRFAGVLERLGFRATADALPLSFYRHLSFHTMRNDSLDRFGTSLEKRYTRAELVELMTSAGLTNVRVSSNVPYWHAVGVRP